MHKKFKSKFRQAALSSVCILSLLSTNAQAFTSADFFRAASTGNLELIDSYVMESVHLLNQYKTGYALNLDLRDGNGDTPLIKAAAMGHVDVVDYLYRHGANLAATNNVGQTAYNLAMRNGHLDVAEYILNTTLPKQADPAYTTFREYPPMTEPAAPQPKPTSSNSWNIPLIGTALGIAAVGGAAALFSGGGGSSNSGGGSTPTDDGSVQFGVTDTGGTSGAGDTHPQSGDPSTYLANSDPLVQEGYAGMGTQYAEARGYDGRIYVRNSATGVLTNNTADGNIKVAVMDTGVDRTHTDLDGNLLAGVKCTTEDGGCVSSTASDTQGHGTFVTGIIAAEKNGTGIQGIAPQAKILPIAFLNEYNGPTYIGSDVSAVQYAVTQNAHIINASYALENANQEIPIMARNTRLCRPTSASMPQVALNTLKLMLSAGIGAGASGI